MKSFRLKRVLLVAAVIVPVLLAANPVRAEVTQFERLYGELLARYWHPASCCRTWNPVSGIGWNHPVTIDYFDHDWTLNDLAQAD